jgi:hypothetical protein
MGGREESLARNEAISREINEGLERGQSTGPPDRYVRMVCECANAGCDRLIAITIAEYEGVRRDPTHFAVVKPHVAPDVERIVEETTRYVVVEKGGPAAKIAEEQDPRS